MQAQALKEKTDAMLREFENTRNVLENERNRNADLQRELAHFKRQN